MNEITFENEVYYHTGVQCVFRTEDNKKVLINTGTGAPIVQLYSNNSIHIKECKMDQQLEQPKKSALKSNEVSLEQIKEVLGEVAPNLDEEVKDVRSIMILTLLKLKEKEWENTVQLLRVFNKLIT